MGLAESAEARYAIDVGRDISLQIRIVEVPEQQEELRANDARLLERDHNTAVQVLIPAILTAFVVFVVASGVRFRDSETLALVVFFVVSIAGAVRAK